jgi:lipopolysaccharide export LptBFGC system permease protein LptF
VRILTGYIRRNYLVTFVLTLLVFTLVTCLLVLFRVADYLAIGGPWRIILRVLLSGFPAGFALAIPVSLLTAALLTFGKLAAGGEITAMKSSGVSMWQILRQPIFFAALASAVCLYLNAEVVPTTYNARRYAMQELGLAIPLEMMEEGRVIREFPGLTFYFERREGNVLHNVVIYQQPGAGVERSIRAKRATVRVMRDRHELLVDLYQVRIDPFTEDRPGFGECEHFPLRIDISRLFRIRPGLKKKSDMTLGELLDQIGGRGHPLPRRWTPARVAQYRTEMRIEVHKRIVLAVACLAFTLFGIPLATLAHRRESAVAVGVSLIVVVISYLFVIVAESMAAHPEYHPHLIPWVPLVAAVAGGIGMVFRNG